MRSSEWELTGADRALLLAARDAARAGAEVHQTGRQRLGKLQWTAKGRSDFVTEVDLEAEQAIVETLLGRFPDHEIVAEEGTADTPDGERDERRIRWIIDPLDGTTNWLHGYPQYAASIAAEDADGLRLGVVLNSATGELFEGVRGCGARLDDRPIRASSLDDLDLALVGTGFPFKKLEVLDDYLATFRRVLTKTSGIRRGGAAALDLCDLACGRLDMFFEYWLMPWDVAAGTLIAREAGAHVEPLRVPGLTGAVPGPVPHLPVGGYIGSNPALWDEFREMVG
jgi:myo-inositol-1(or 4)-monophosphatase